MDFVWKERLRTYWPWLVGVLAIMALGTALTFWSFAATPNSTVDFNKITMQLANKPFSSTISTYGASDTDITKNDSQRTELGNLKAGYYRVPLQWNGGAIVSSAGGHPGGSGDSWVGSIKAIGAEPEIVIGGSSDNNFSPDDAGNLVQHFNKPTSGPANRVNVWVVGNEPNNNGMSIQAYCTLFNASVDKMKAVDPTIKVAGPAWAFFDAATLKSFLQCAGNKVDVVDYHHYAMGGTFEPADSIKNANGTIKTMGALDETHTWGDEVRQTRALIDQIVPTRSAQIEVQVGEYNWSWRTDNGYPGRNFDDPGKPGDDRLYQPVATVWAASVAGQIAAAGGRGHEYADLNGGLGLTFEKQLAANFYNRKLTDPMPIYYGLEMFTGGNLFRGFGAQLASASTSLDEVEIYASASSKNIVMINKSPTTAQTAVVKLDGFSGGTADIWQTNKDAPFDAPVHKNGLAVSDTLQYDLPPYSVTTFVLTESGTPAAPVTPPVTPPPTTPPTTSPPVSSLQPVPVRINAGGGQYTDPTGAVWKADFGYSGGNTDSQAAGRAIANTPMAQLYQDERWGNFSYHIPVARGTYKVRLHFAEIYNGCQTAGCRVFNVSANGSAWLANYDIAAQNGANKAAVEEKTLTLSSDALDLTFSGVIGSAQLAAIEVVAADAPPPATPPAPAPTPSTPAPTAANRGLNATYFPAKDLSGTGVSRTDQTINFHWGAGAPLAGIPANQFSARWAGSLTAPTTGTYTFYLTGDDGVRMWLDGQQVIDGWRDQSSREYQASVQLTAGKPVQIRVEYYENYGDAVAELDWSGPGLKRQPVPASVLSTAAPGLAVSYYPYNGGGATGSAALYSGTDQTIDFIWGAGRPNSAVPADRFSATWAGNLTAPTSGTYTFVTESDDGVRLWVNNMPLIDDWTDHQRKQDNGTVTLAANQTYSIKVSYYENYGDAVMRLLWKTPGQATASAVPESVLTQN
ncbi:MAG TPA: PA14 domain-containing protein [Candidatus Saccharimonadales bacterium]|nr:PA14 domain-containing protein [Candidatus Saccharimonadales bacterium]